MRRAMTPLLVQLLIAGAAIFAVPGATSAQQYDQEIALAVLPLPEDERSEATVLGYRAGELVPLREGEGAFLCLADTPDDEDFHVACYHKSLEPYMARGRELRDEGVETRTSIEKRWEEIESGELVMPRHPALLYQLFGATPSSPSREGLTSLTVIYMAYQTAEETGLPAKPVEGLPWLMFSGKPTAHVMISG